MANSEASTRAVSAQSTAKIRRIKNSKFVKVYDGGMPGVCEGLILDEFELERLASWLCERCALGCKGGDRRLPSKHYCDECRDMAGLLLSECPYIDMTLPDQLVFEVGETMRWQERDASIPNDRVCIPIDEKKQGTAAQSPEMETQSTEQRIIVGLLASTPDRALPNDELDLLVAGGAAGEATDFVLGEWPSWVSAVPESIAWWGKLAWTALDGLEIDASEMEKRVREFQKLQSEALAAYSPAFTENRRMICDPDAPTEATVGLAVRYRLFTKHVEALVLEAFPSLDRDLLLNH